MCQLCTALGVALKVAYKHLKWVTLKVAYTHLKLVEGDCSVNICRHGFAFIHARLKMAAKTDE